MDLTCQHIEEEKKASDWWKWALFSGSAPVDVQTDYRTYCVNKGFTEPDLYMLTKLAHMNKWFTGLNVKAIVMYEVQSLKYWEILYMPYAHWREMCFSSELVVMWLSLKFTRHRGKLFYPLNKLCNCLDRCITQDHKKIDLWALRAIFEHTFCPWLAHFL